MLAAVRVRWNQHSALAMFIRFVVHNQHEIFVTVCVFLCIVSGWYMNYEKMNGINQRIVQLQYDIMELERQITLLQFQLKNVLETDQ